MNEILILGAGYTGLAATTALAGRVKGRDDVHITLVNPQTRFTERLRLHQTASGQALADLQIPDQLDGAGVDFVQGWVTGIDADAQTDRVKKREATERFFAATTGGDINELMELLAPEVTLWTDGGGKVRQAMRPIIGAVNVAKWIAGTIKRPYEGVEISDMTAELVDNGGPGIVMSGGGRVIATITVDLDADSRIVTVHNVANADKLHAVADAVKRI